MDYKKFGVLGFGDGGILVRLRFNMDIESKVDYTVKSYFMNLKKEIWTNSKNIEHIVLTGAINKEQLDALKKLKT